MDSSPTAPSTRPWRFPWLVLFGVGLLVVSAVGANHALNGSNGGPGPTTPGDLTELEWQQIRSQSFGFVDVAEGVVNLYPTQLGRVTDVFVKEGELVEARTPLFRMDDRLASETVKAATEDLAAAELRVEAAEAEVRKHDKHLAALRLALQAKEVELEGARPALTQAQRLADKNLGPREAVAAAEAKLKALGLELDGKRAELAGAEAIDAAKLVELAKRDVAAKTVQLAKANLALTECQVVAPAKGRVLRFFIRPGEPLGGNPRTPAAQFVGETPRIVRAEITQERAADVHVGQTATVVDDVGGRSRRGWNARVIYVSDWFSPRRSMEQAPLQLNDIRTIEAILEFTGEAPPVKIGQKVVVRLHK